MLLKTVCKISGIIHRKIQTWYDCEVIIILSDRNWMFGTSIYVEFATSVTLFRDGPFLGKNFTSVL